MQGHGTEAVSESTEPIQVEGRNSRQEVGQSHGNKVLCDDMIHCSLTLIVPECGQVSDVVETKARPKAFVDQRKALTVKRLVRETITALLMAAATSADRSPKEARAIAL